MNAAQETFLTLAEAAIASDTRKRSMICAAVAQVIADAPSVDQGALIDIVRDVGFGAEFYPVAGTVGVRVTCDAL